MKCLHTSRCALPSPCFHAETVLQELKCTKSEKILNSRSEPARVNGTNNGMIRWLRPAVRSEIKSLIDWCGNGQKLSSSNPLFLLPCTVGYCTVVSVWQSLTIAFRRSKAAIKALCHQRHLPRSTWRLYITVRQGKHPWHRLFIFCNVG